MAFNSRKFQKLMEEEQKNNASLVDEFEDDFADDFEDAAEEAQPEAAAAFEPENNEVTDFEPTPVEEVAEEEAAEEVVAEEPAPEEAQPEESAKEEFAEEVQETAKEEEPTAEPAQPEETVCVSEPIIAVEPEAKPAAEVYDPHKMWQDMASLAVSAKECITAGAFFRANDIVSAMRSMLVEMMCRANGINENFNENADNLNDDCKQDIYTSYAATLNAKELSGAVTHIMAVTYKYI